MGSHLGYAKSVVLKAIARGHNKILRMRPLMACARSGACQVSLCRLRTSFITTTKNTGTNTTARVAVIIPPITPVPIACWLAELAPVAIASGTTPRMNARDVMTIGRSRKRAACRVASSVTDRFLDVALQYVGAVPYDESVRKAVQKQRAVYEAFPRSKCALAFKAIAQKVDTWPLPANPRGHLEFFVERLVQQTAGPVL